MKRAVLALVLAACGSKRAAPVKHDAGVAIDADPGFAPLGPAAAPPRTADGIPILEVAPVAADRTGDVRWLRPRAQTLDSIETEASDGARIYWAQGFNGDDVLIRDGVIREHVLASLGALHAGCASAVDGTILFSSQVYTARDVTVVTTDGTTGQRSTKKEKARAQATWRIALDGAVTRTELPETIGGGGGCHAWLAVDGQYRLALAGIVDWDGHTFAEDRDFYAGRTVTGGPGRPKYCFASCNEAEAAQTAPMTRALIDALDCRLGNERWTAYQDRVAGSCGDKVVRYREGGKPEVVAIPATSGQLVFTDRGDLVIAVDYEFARYVVWPDGAAAVSPERRLEHGERLAETSPTLLVRGLAGAVPATEAYAILVGRDLRYGTNGATIGYTTVNRAPRAHQAQADRARAVLGAGELLVAGEAVLERACGARVRSPIGWEDTDVSDGAATIVPPLDPRAVIRAPACLPITAVAALPGDPGLLFAISGGALWGAWLDVPGWTRLAGGATAVVGIDGVPAPGSDVELPRASWQHAGAAELTLDGATVLVTPNGAVTLPPATTPMAVGWLTHGPGVWGAIGAKLVVCDQTCRVLDPGVPATIVGVVPRTATEVILGYDDGRVGVYAVPATGGDVTPRHPAADAIDALIAQRPR